MVDEFLKEIMGSLEICVTSNGESVTHVYRLGDDSSSAEGDEAREQQAEGSNQEGDGHHQEEDLGRVIGSQVGVATKVVGHDSNGNGSEDLVREKSTG